MKILHVTASYKPAFIYGGPIYSVAALCEALLKSQEQLVKIKEVESQKLIVESRKIGARGKYIIEVDVYTTLANGKEELPFSSGELKMNLVRCPYKKH